MTTDSNATCAVGRIGVVKTSTPVVTVPSADVAHCYVHRLPMPDTYETSSAFLLVTYSWRGHEDAFPNARLYTVPDSDLDASDRITLTYCARCELALQEWLERERSTN